MMNNNNIKQTGLIFLKKVVEVCDLIKVNLKYLGGDLRTPLYKISGIISENDAEIVLRKLTSGHKINYPS